MNRQLSNQGFMFVIALVLFGAVMRLIPHWPNFTPVTAMALMGGVYLSRKHLGYVIPLAAMLISDIFLGFHSFMLPVYGTFVLIVFLAGYLRKRLHPATLAGASVATSLLFFLITNFFVWLTTPIYPHNAAGLLACYTAGLPFLKNGVLGDLLYSGIFFGSFYLARLRFPALQYVEK